MAMKRIVFFLGMITCAASAWAQKTTLDPVISPALFQYNTPITVTYDVTGTALASLTDAYIWVWIPANTAIGSKYNVNPATAGQAPAKFTKSIESGKTLFKISFTPSDFFTSSIQNESSMGMLLKGADWSNGQTTDYIAPFGFTAKLVTPSVSPYFVNNGDIIQVKVTTPAPADFVLKINNVTTDTKSGLTEYTYSFPASNAQASSNVSVTATANSQSSTVGFTYYIATSSPNAARPSGIIDGINYSGDPTKVTLSLWAPQKSNVYLLGDFNNWTIDPAYIMKKDGEHFWYEVTGLTAGTEYGYQYLVDQTVYIADPYADKILDPLDQYIPATTYPNLKAYPDKANHGPDYFNRVAVFQTNQTPYVWKTTGWTRPKKENLVIYELLVRDFFAKPNNNYQSLIDTISYFKNLGVNAIELMPPSEFSGNESWGYNPTFMFAPDKAYGTKDKLKEFIDLCHENGIAVIMDMVMNQQDLPNPYVAMYFNFSNYTVLPNNPWFNVTATHPFSVFYDMNHESSYTKKYLDTVNYYWLNQYRFDGLRFDLSKGFTQKVNSDVGAWGAYDQSRVNILTRMADVIWSKAPDAIVILEHFADNSEEKVLTNYRADEGKGMMVWANFNYAYNQNTKGQASNSDFSTSYFANRDFSYPHAVSYMESHDEERMMYRNLTEGSASGSYNTKDLNTALARMKTAATVFYTVPGPHMLWEFGELGYDKSINTCPDGTVNNCRTDAKPVLWNYYSVDERKALHDHVADLLRLRNSYDVFTDGVATFNGTTTLAKQITLKNVPYTTTPSDSTEMNVQVVGNFELTAQVISVNFSHKGTWYDYYNEGKSFTVSGTTENIFLEPGEYKIYTDIRIASPKSEVVTGVENHPVTLSLYPNPADGVLYLSSDAAVSSLVLRTLQGGAIAPKRIADDAWDVHELPTGMYIAQVRTQAKLIQVKVIKK